jgi:hypothetical protein
MLLGDRREFAAAIISAMPAYAMRQDWLTAI